MGYQPQQQTNTFCWDLYVRSDRENTRKFVNLPTFVYPDKNRLSVRHNGIVLNFEMMHSGVLVNKPMFLNDVAIRDCCLVDRLLLGSIAINEKVTVFYDEKQISLKPMIKFFCYDKETDVVIPKQPMPSKIIRIGNIKQANKGVSFNAIETPTGLVTQYLPNAAQFTNYPIGHDFLEHGMIVEVFSRNNETGKDTAVACFSKNYFELFNLVYNKNQKYKQVLKFRVRNTKENTVSEWAPYGLLIAGPLPLGNSGFYKISQVVKL